MRPFALVRPESLVRARELILAKPEVHVLRAGGIDLLDRLKEGLDEPELLVELARITSAVPLAGVARTGATTSIGALTILATLAEPLGPGLDALEQAAREAATPGIRNTATIAGNLLQRPRCWYFRNRELVCLKKGGDTCLALTGDNRYHAILGGGPVFIVHPSSLATALLALDATVAIWSASAEQPEGGERVIPLAELFVGPQQDPTREHALAPGEIVTAIVVDAKPEQRSAYQAVREKQSHDWPLAEAAVRLRLEGGRMRDVRVALGHVAPVPWLAREAAELLENQAPSLELFAAAAEAALAPAKPLDGNAYKIPLSKGLLREVLHRAADLPLPE
ncbi:FAD binding domain-containing protein [Nannocystaceae bacterium ST9]